ncbi:Predicted arabinose efflux permease, MFS family [Nitrosospira sp. Nsp11]|uniref:MFS transporter n=1 Tax=Nitrosospira sp. Nsp11 TaxID=1855338 RepID=UPI000924327B|nr:MFS transporter [Nitrosospira sp. Nsp11]SHL84835.1 Predicted arabinose efflux permease, MFS family [Nitrosospira sp. Nsp11]
MDSPILTRILWVRGLRAFGDGYVSLLLPVYLIELGMNPFEVGTITTATLIGSGIVTLLAGFQAYRFTYKTLLLAATALMAATGFSFAAITEFWPLLLVAFVGTLNPSSGDVSLFLPLEHAVLSRFVGDRQRTAVFVRYSMVGALVAAAGALAAGLPDFAAASIQIDARDALQAMFVLYGIIGLLCAAIYATLPEETGSTETGAVNKTRSAPLKKSRKIVYTLAALFSLDAFGGGFVVQAMLALWLFQKFQLSISMAGTIFFWTGIFSALSYLAAIRIANRFGLINTMVFTHLPANVLLILIPFMPTLGWAIALLLIRSGLSQMDVPARSSYVMAIVPPAERAAAASMTSVPRSLASAAGPFLAGYLLSISSFGWSLVIAGGLKIIYDLLLLRMFRTVKPPEEGHLNGQSNLRVNSATNAQPVAQLGPDQQ